MFEHMEITKSIYEGVVEYSNKKITWADANRAGTSGIKWEKPPRHGLALRSLRALTSAENDM